jgi:23S rRNA (pseudouridine1915-N3)-methyltransferase
MSRQITVLAVGRLKRDTHQDLIDHYVKQIAAQLTIVELETGDFKSENVAIRAEIAKQPQTIWIALDRRGDDVTSEKFASMLEPHSRLGFIIGGADGLDDDTRTLCKHAVAFGRAIWPHKLARVMLIEQVFRAHHIWANHPYHRA